MLKSRSFFNFIFIHILIFISAIKTRINLNIKCVTRGTEIVFNYNTFPSLRLLILINYVNTHFAIN